VGYIVQVLSNAITPVLEAMGHAMEAIAPVIVMVGAVLEALTPAFMMINAALGALEKPLMWFVNVVLRGLFEVLRFVGLAIGYIIKGIASVWNGIISAIQSVFKKLGDISILGKHPLGFLKDWARSMESAKFDTEALARSLQELEGLTWDAAMAKARETAEVMKNRDALADVNEALSNVPSLWKVALRRFDAQDAQDGSNALAGGKTPQVATPPPAPIIDDPEPGRSDRQVSLPGMPAFNVTVVGYDIDDAVGTAMEQLEAFYRRLGFRRHGTSAAVAPRYA
jgi:hypothetical protein